MQTHFLQSETWKQFQLALGRQTVEGHGDGWAYLATVSKDRFGTFLYAPYGPSAIDETALKLAIADMKLQAKKLGAYVIIAEPYLPITANMAANVLPYHVKYRQPPATLTIDLTQSEDDIIAAMNATRRNQHRNYQKKGIEIVRSNDPKDMELFFQLHQDSSAKKGFFIRDKKFFDTMAHTLLKDGDAILYFAKFEDKAIMSILLYDDGTTRYYAYMGRDYAYEYMQANGPLLSHIITDAKADGRKVFDLFGVSLDDNPKNPWHGFTTFKKTFGGTPVVFAGTWELPISNVRYTAQKLARKIKK